MPVESAVTLLQVAIGGVLLGAVYALLACGLNLIFGVMRVINVAHGELMMLGSYTTFWLFFLLGINPLLSLLFSIPLMFLLGMGIQKFLVSRVVKAPELMSLLVTFGISMFILSLALYFWSADFRSVPYFTGSITLGSFAFSRPRVIAFGIAVVITLAVYIFLKKTKLGKAVRATSQSSEVAAICGVDVERIRLLTFGLGSALAAAAGSLLVVIYAVNPSTGQTFILKAFAIIVLGGMGSFLGAFIGALILGLAEAFTSFFFTAQLSEAVAYLLLILVLLFMPSGLLGERE
ncbi:MAG: branched-chain amino acid ABC transporter permease [Euryarchaeota archaeon]|nr:branched-chain amino acid ABC transporter permease [Euryarchaeota archaeon]